MLKHDIHETKDTNILKESQTDRINQNMKKSLKSIGEPISEEISDINESQLKNQENKAQEIEKLDLYQVKSFDRGNINENLDDDCKDKLESKKLANNDLTQKDSNPKIFKKSQPTNNLEFTLMENIQSNNDEILTYQENEQKQLIEDKNRFEAYEISNNIVNSQTINYKKDEFVNETEKNKENESDYHGIHIIKKDSSKEKEEEEEEKEEEKNLKKPKIFNIFNLELEENQIKTINFRKENQFLENNSQKISHLIDDEENENSILQEKNKISDKNIEENFKSESFTEINEIPEKMKTKSSFLESERG